MEFLRAYIYMISIGSLLDLYWIIIGALLGLYWIYIGSSLDLHWTSIGSLLDLYWIDAYWISIGSLIGSLLDLYWISTWSQLDLYWLSTGHRNHITIFLYSSLINFTGTGKAVYGLWMLCFIVRMLETISISLALKGLRGPTWYNIYIHSIYHLKSIMSYIYIACV